MSDPLFLGALTDPLPGPGERVELGGPEGRHAAVVRRIAAGEIVIIGDGAGRGVRGRVIAAGPDGLTVEVIQTLLDPAPARTITAVQALAKGDRAELAVEAMTEVGVDRIVPWQASRSIVRWQGERGERSRAKWQATAREAAKQSRRLRVPEISPAVSTAQVAAAIARAAAGVVLHEDASDPLDAATLPDAGEVIIVIGPEGGIAPDELDRFVAAGARPVLVGDAVLRTSTAGVVAVSWLRRSLISTPWAASRSPGIR